MLSSISDCDNGGYVVDSIASSDVANGRDIDILKLDCEGAEWEILSSGSLLKRARVCMMEYHEVGGYKLQELKDIIHAFGHRVIYSDDKEMDNVNCGMLISERN
jgi:hypothetical protein